MRADYAIKSTCSVSVRRLAVQGRGNRGQGSKAGLTAATQLVGPTEAAYTALDYRSYGLLFIQKVPQGNLKFDRWSTGGDKAVSSLQTGQWVSSVCF